MDRQIAIPLFGILISLGLWALIYGCIHLFEPIYRHTKQYRIVRSTCKKYWVENLIIETTRFNILMNKPAKDVWDGSHYSLYDTKEEAIERINAILEGNKYYYPTDYIEQSESEVV